MRLLKLLGKPQSTNKRRTGCLDMERSMEVRVMAFKKVYLVRLIN